MKNKVSAVVMLCVICFTSSVIFAKMLENKKTKLPTLRDRQERIKARVAALDEKLNLSTEQEKKITDILNKSKADIALVLDEAGDKVSAIKIQAELDLQAALTQEQRELFNKVDEQDSEDDPYKVIKSAY
ncbi:MAG: hypothetical protein KBA46_00010 [Candidatus Omnitrophica bacterium]|nr:hypothetical protein [Candidatus Omnitrophota bacterium]